MIRLLTVFVLAFASLSLYSSETICVSLPASIERPRESHYRDALAAVLRARGETVQTEVVLKGGRADIVTEKYAIEVDRACKWHEAIGQALHYAMQLRLKPCIALIDADSLTADQLAALKSLCARRRIEIFLLKQQENKGYE